MRNKKERQKIQKTWRNRREKSGLDGKTFAQKHGFIPEQLSRWERAVYTPSATSCRRVESALAAEGV